MKNCEQLYAHAFQSSEQMNQIFENHKLPKHNKMKQKNLNMLITVQEIIFAIKSSWKSKLQGQMVPLDISIRHINKK